MTEPSPAAAPTPRPRRRRRWKLVLASGAVLVLVLAAIVVFLPAILSTPFGKGRLEALLAKELGRPVEAGGIELSWTGPQRVEGLRIPSPEGFPPGKDLLAVSRASLSTGLLGLIFSGGEVRVEIEEPEVNLIRDSRGRFNLGPPPPGKEKGEKGEKEGKEGGPRAPGGGEGLPRVPRKVSIVLQGGRLHYEDQVLRTSSDLEGVGVDLKLEEDRARLDGGATIVRSGGAPGRLRVSVFAGGLTGRPARWQIEGRASAEDVDLKPYRALLEEYFQVTPPEKPVGGDLDFKTEDGAVRIASSLEASFARLSGVSGTIPLEPGGTPATLKVPFSVDLAPALASLKRLSSSLREGTRAAGQVSGSLEVSAPVALEDLSRKGAAALAGASLALSLETRGLEVVLPAGGGGAGEAEKGGGPPKEPFRFSKDLSLAVKAAAGETLETLTVQSARLSGKGIQADLSAAIEPAKGAAPAGRPITLKGSLDLQVPEVLSALTGLFPKEIEAGPESSIRLGDLVLSGELGGGKAPGESLSGKGRLEVAGPIKYRGFQVEKEAGDISIGGGKVDLSGASATVNGGKVDARELSFGLGPAPAYRLDLQASGVSANYDMSPLLAYVVPILSPGLRQAELGGQIQSTLKVEGRGFSTEELAKALKGGGMLRVLDGHIQGSRFLDELEKLVGTKVGNLVFSELGSDFSIGEGKVACSRVFLQGKEGGKVRNLGLKGVTGLDGSLDYGVDLAVLSDTIGDRKIKKVLEVARNALKQDVLPLKMKGTFASPRLSLEPSLEKLDLQGILDEIPGLGGGKKPAQEKPGESGGGAKGGGEASPKKGKEKEKKPSLQDLLDDLLKKR